MRICLKALYRKVLFKDYFASKNSFFRRWYNNGTTFVFFIDDLLWYSYVYLMKYKFKVFEKFKEFKAEVEDQIGKSIKIL